MLFGQVYANYCPFTEKNRQTWPRPNKWWRTLFCLFCFLISISETPNPLPIMDIVPWSIKRQICVHPRLLCYFRLKCARVGPKQPPKYSSFLMHVLFDLYFPFANLMDPNFGYLVLCGQIILPETFLLITCPNNIYWSFFCFIGLNRTTD